MTEIQNHTDGGLERTKEPGYPAVSRKGFALGGSGARSRLDSRAFSFSAVASDSVPTMETGPMCKRNTKHRTERRDGQLRTYLPDCMCWKCETCRPKLQTKWIVHGTACLRECGTRISVVTIPVDSFVWFARRLSRAHARYIRVRDGLEYIVFVATNNAGILACGVEVSASRAVDLFTDMVRNIRSSAGGNPISTCRAWSLPSRERSTWELVAEGPTPEQIRKAVEVAKCGEAIKCLDRTINGLTVTVCSGPTIAIDSLCELIGSLECENHSIKAKCWCKKEFDSDSDDCVSWRGYPDEEPAPYSVGAVT